jgi:D-alanyl-D-alanine carboxypeptidase (penicillin-binding protein 5/6)
LNRRQVAVCAGLIALAVITASVLSGGESPRRTVALASPSPPPGTPAEGSFSSSDSEAREIVECPACHVTKPPSTATPIPTLQPPATPTPAPTSTPVPTPTPEAPFEVPARAVAILEADCGALVYGKDEHLPLPPASLTKIITALAVIDRVHLSDKISADISARELKQRTRSSVMGLEPGMTVSMEDLLYGLFLPSGNDAAIELAEHVGGSEEAFATLMNETAQTLGLQDSRFDNPHGLDSPGLQSSAYDMAIAGMALMRNPTLATISAASSYTLAGGLHLRNGNQLLEQYPGAYGVKIGRTRAAKSTIVGAAARDNRRLFISVFGSEDLYNETARLLDWAFTLPPRC